MKKKKKKEMFLVSWQCSLHSWISTSLGDVFVTLVSSSPAGARGGFTTSLVIWFIRSVLLLLFSRSVVFDSLQPHGLEPVRLLCLWDSPGKNTEVCCRFLLQRIFPTQGLNLCLLHCRLILYHWAIWEACVRCLELPDCNAQKMWNFMWWRSEWADKTELDGQVNT